MNRSINISSAGRRIFGTPKAGILAEKILAETAAGDDGAGALHNEAEQAEYAGKYLRLRVLNFPTVGKLFVHENGTVDWQDLPVGVHAFEYALDVNAVPQPGSAWFTITVGAVDAAAPGATLTGTATLTPGTAAGQQSATAPGATLTGTADLTPGTATGTSSGTAPGATLTGTATLTPGAATGEQNASAPGATLTGTATLEPGSAVGTNPGTAPGVTLTGTATLTPGAAVATNPNATAPGTTLTGTASLTPGTAVATDPNATAPGVTLTGAATLVPGMAHDGSTPLEPGPEAWRVRSLPRDWNVRALPRHWTVRSTKQTATGEIMPLPIKDPEEVKTITFDFSADAETINSAAVTPTYLSGAADAAPADVLEGSPSVNGSLVMQRVKTGQDGTNYAIRCKGVDADGEVHIISVELPVKTKTPV